MKFSNFNYSGKLNGMKHCKDDCSYQEEFESFLQEVEHISSSIETLSQVNRLILEYTDENILIHKTCNVICQNNNYDFAALVYFDDLSRLPFLSASSDHSSSYNQIILDLISDSELLNLIKRNKAVLLTSHNSSQIESQIVVLNKNPKNSTALFLP